MNWPSRYKRKKLVGVVVTVAALGLGIAWVWVPKMRSAAAQKATGAELEYFNSTASFSEVDNARATLEAEVARFITELRQSYVRIRMNRSNTNSESLAAYQQWLASLRAKVQEFKGTLQEPKILQEMFMVARMGELKAEWLEEYLRLLYENPTQPLIASLTKDALETARELDREADLIKAFIHLLQVPLDLENKRAVQSVLANAGIKSAGHRAKSHRHAQGTATGTQERALL